VDLSLLEILTERGHNVVVAGKVSSLPESGKRKWQALLTLDTFHYLGVVPSRELKELIAASTVCITAYRFSLTKKIGSGSPLKVLHYLSQEKPVITTIDAEIPDLKGKAIYRAAGNTEFVALVKDALHGRLEVDRQAIRQELAGRSYPKLINRIMAHVK
jgi:hypothetical protein